MNYLLLNYIEWVSNMIINNIIIVFALPCKRIRSRLAHIGILSAFQILPLTFKFFFNESDLVRNLALALTVGAILLYQHFFQEDQFFKKLLFNILILAVSFLGELLAMVVLADRLEGVIISLNQPLAFTFLIYQFLFATIFLIIMLLLWNLLLRKVHYQARSLILFFAFPISQILLVNALDSEIHWANMRAEVGLSVGVVISFLADIYLLYVLLEQQRKAEIEQNLREMQTQMLLSQEHYKEIERRRDEFAKIRHDLNNQMMVVQDLIQQNQTEKAQEMLTNMLGYVANTREYEYCADPIVNAVLSENKALCAEKNIAYDCDIPILQPLTLDPVKVCSIFSNLLRNAVAATDACPDAEHRRIDVIASVSGAYLNVKVSNGIPQKDAVKKKKQATASRKHYGLEILKQIAEEYHGHFETCENDRLFEAFISVQL